MRERLCRRCAKAPHVYAPVRFITAVQSHTRIAVSNQTDGPNLMESFSTPLRSIDTPVGGHKVILQTKILFKMIPLLFIRMIASS